MTDKDMPDNGESTAAHEALRNTAERIASGEATGLPEEEQLDLLRLAHELELAQVELETQNEQLRKISRELEDSRLEFWDLYESAPVAFVTLSEKNIVERTNAAARQMLCGPDDRLVGHAFSNFVVPEDMGAYFRNIKKIAASEKPSFFELRIVDKTAKPIQVYCQASTKFGPEGGFRRRQLAFFDITERKQAEEILRGYKEKLELEVQDRTAEIEKQYRELEQLNLFTKQMARQTIRAMENDRRALSKEIHDSIGGSLAAIKTMLDTRLDSFKQPPSESVMFFEEIIGHLVDTLKESRRISYQMRSLVLDDFGLAAAVSETLKMFKEFYPKIEVDLQVDISHDDIPEEIKTVVYRVVQEALNNIGKHSGADFVKIELTGSRDRILLKIEDNGCGFDVQKTLENNQALQGFGMLGMKERVEICKGSFQVQSEPGKGTILSASIPAKAI
jgi:PAS domain S-box-containing protein